MSASIGDAQIEGAAAVPQIGASAPPFARRIMSLRATGPGHQHGTQIGDGINNAHFSRAHKMFAGLLFIFRTAEAVEIHEAEVENGCREACFSSLRIIRPGCSKILMDAAPMMQHGPEIIGSGGMAFISGLAHECRSLQQTLAALAVNQQGEGFFKQRLPIHHEEHDMENRAFA